MTFDSCRRFILRLQGEVQGCDIFHIAAVGDWVEWGEQTLCMHICLGLCFISHRELDGESWRFLCGNLFWNKTYFVNSGPFSEWVWYSNWQNSFEWCHLKWVDDFNIHSIVVNKFVGPARFIHSPENVEWVRAAMQQNPVRQHVIKQVISKRIAWRLEISSVQNSHNLRVERTG